MSSVEYSSPTRAAPLLLLVLLFEIVTSSTILLVPFPSYAHVNPLVALGEVLMEKGHSVHIYIPSLYGHLANLKVTTKVKVIEYQVRAWEWNAAMHAGKVDTETDYFDYVTQTSYVADLKAKHNGYHLLCKALMASKILDLHIKHGVTFDLGILDSHPLTRCHYTLMYKHGIPYVSYSQVYDPAFTSSPAMPSYVPSFLTERLTDDMTLWQRLMNAWTVLHWSMGGHLPAQTPDFTADYVPSKPAVSMQELASRSRLWLSDTNFLLDYSRPTVSNEVLVSWALMRDAKPLPKDHVSLENLNATKDGIIIISLDQNIALPARIVAAILTSFKIFQTYHIVWQYNGDLTEETIPGNVHVLPYIPLNDLLGHPKVKLLVTSADTYHQNMALYHSVPVLCFPLHPAQRTNAHKTEYRQHGIVIPPADFSLKTLVLAMKRLVQNDTYYRNIQETSRIMKTQQPHSQRALADWVELSLANDFDELRPFAVDMAWHHYHMIDIFVIIIIVFGNLSFLVFNVIVLGIKRLRLSYRTRKGSDTTATSPTPSGVNNGKHVAPPGVLTSKPLASLPPSTTAAATPGRQPPPKPFKQH